MPKRPKGFPLELSKSIKLSNKPLTKLAWLRGEIHGLDSPPSDQTERKKIEKEIALKIQSDELNAIIQKFQKMEVLAKHYGIVRNKEDPIWIQLLCIRLCEDFFKGFEIKYESKKYGRPKTVDLAYMIELVNFVENQMNEGANTTKALQRFHKKKSGKIPTAQQLKTLRNHLSQARKLDFKLKRRR